MDFQRARGRAPSPGGRCPGVLTAASTLSGPAPARSIAQANAPSVAIGRPAAPPLAYDSSRMPAEEVVLPFPGPRERIVPADAFRSTWIVSSIQSLRSAGHFDRYAANLPESHRQEILQTVAAVWLPMPVARIHYEACDRLKLSVDDQIALGSSVGERAQGTLLATAVRAARGAGVTPWTILPQFDRLYHRGNNGGAIAVFKIGPKDARVEAIGCELFDIDYFRNAFRGVLLGIMALFTPRAYVHEVKRGRGEVTFHFQWV